MSGLNVMALTAASLTTASLTATEAIKERGSRVPDTADDGILRVCDRLAFELWKALKAMDMLRADLEWTIEDIGVKVDSLELPRFEMVYIPRPMTFFGERGESKRPSGQDCVDFVRIARLAVREVFRVMRGRAGKPA